MMARCWPSREGMAQVWGEDFCCHEACAFRRGRCRAGCPRRWRRGTRKAPCHRCRNRQSRSRAIPALQDRAVFRSRAVQNESRYREGGRGRATCRRARCSVAFRIGGVAREFAATALEGIEGGEDQLVFVGRSLGEQAKVGRRPRTPDTEVSGSGKHEFRGAAVDGYAAISKVFSVIAAKIRVDIPAVDISEVMDDVATLLDYSIATQGCL
jgi:hypothetical protein